MAGCNCTGACRHGGCGGQFAPQPNPWGTIPGLDEYAPSTTTGGAIGIGVDPVPPCFTPNREAWKCPECQRVNAPHVDQCPCAVGSSAWKAEALPLDDERE